MTLVKRFREGWRSVDVLCDGLPEHEWVGSSRTAGCLG